jgi:hypothetical protein
VGGLIAFAFNDTFYTHRLWSGFPNAIPNDSAFCDARCTPRNSSVGLWECSSWGVTITTNTTISQIETVPVTVYASTTVLPSEHLYEISAESLKSTSPCYSWTISSQASSTASMMRGDGPKARSGTLVMETAPVQMSDGVSIKHSARSTAVDRLIGWSCGRYEGMVRNGS